MGRYDREFGGYRPYSGDRSAYGTDYYRGYWESSPGGRRSGPYGYDYGYPRSPTESSTYGRGGDRSALRWAREHGYDQEYTIEPHRTQGEGARAGERDWREREAAERERARRYRSGAWSYPDRGSRELFGRGGALRDRGLGEEYDWNYRW